MVQRLYNDDPPPFFRGGSCRPPLLEAYLGGPHTHLPPCPHRLGRSVTHGVVSVRRFQHRETLRAAILGLLLTGGWLTWPTAQVLLDNVEQGCDVISSDHSESTVHWVSDLNINKLQRSEQPPLKPRGFLSIYLPPLSLFSWVVNLFSCSA